MMKAHITALIIILTACSLYAKEYHVSTAGHDGNPGSEARPFKTITKATYGGLQPAPASRLRETYPHL